MNYAIYGLPIALLLIFPLWRLHERAGLNPFWALLVFVPAIGVLMVVVHLALARWPSVDEEFGGAR